MSIKSLLKTGFLWSFCLVFGLQVQSYATNDMLWLESLLAQYNIPQVRDHSQDSFEDLIQEKYSPDSPETESYPMQNMYLVMVQNLIDGPRQTAIKTLSYRTPYTKSDLEKILIEGDLSPISKKAFRSKANVYQNIRLNGENSEESLAAWAALAYATPEALAGKDPSLATINSIYAQLQQDYKTELAYAMENKEINYQVMARELFLNGNRADSAGIDILSDLDDLHQLFFGESLLAILEAEEEDEPSIDLASEEETEPLDESSTLPLCGDDEALRSALELYEARAEIIQENNPNPAKDSSSQSSESPSRDRASASASPSDEALELEEQNEGRQAKKDMLQTRLPASQPPQDQKYCFNNNRFCVIIDFKYASWGLSSPETMGVAGAHPPTQKCYACHLAYIREHLDKTLSKSLIPGRLTTNFFEDATCKEAAGKINLDFKVITIGVPIDLKPGKDPYEKIIDSLEDIQTNILGGQGFWKGRRPKIQDALVNRYQNRVTIEDKSEQVSYGSEEFAEASSILRDIEKEIELQSGQVLSESLSKNLRLLQENVSLLQESLEAGASTLNSLLNEKQTCR